MVPRTTGQPAAGGFVVPLDSAEAALPHLAGGKAANLARLLAAGFPVPGGLVVTTTAFAAHLRHAGSAPPSARLEALDNPLPAAVEAALREALSSLGSGPLAVRSSGVGEDLAGASFAGQYESVLDVRGVEAVILAVRRCWASTFAAHLERYRESSGVAAAPMAVLIQPLIQADAAGVAFTANPVTGDRGEVVVSAVRGPGDRLVSGAATPDEWTVRAGRAACRLAPEGALEPGQVLAIAELARRTEAHFGSPQDIEWVYRRGSLYLLQARPITTLDSGPRGTRFPSAGGVPPGFWQRADSHYPLPLYPLTRSVLLPAANRGFRRMCDEFGLLTETVEEREIGGYVYLRAVPLGGKDRSPPPDWLLRLAVRLLPSLRARIRRCEEAIRDDRARWWVDRWSATVRGSLTRRIDALRGMDLAALTDAELARHLSAVRTLLDESQEIHMLLNQSQNLLLAEFAFACRDLLGWDESRAFGLLAGLSHTSSAPAHALSRLADLARSNPELLRLLESAGEATPERLAEVDPGFGEAFEGYRREFGFRTLRYEVADPTLAEAPRLLVSLLRDQLRRGYDPAAEAGLLAEERAVLTGEARKALSARTAGERERFERALARAIHAYPLREEHGFHDTMMPLALVRRAALEAGARLADRGSIPEPQDVFFLEIGEIQGALGRAERLHALVEGRAGERQRALRSEAPHILGQAPAVAPSFAALPEKARFAHEAVAWFVEQVFAGDASRRLPSDAAVVRGHPGSRGRFTGPVRVIRTENEFDRIRPGDVLVCPITSPVWSVLFPSVGALVTDAGGFLSHSAIIAREYRIPAVVGTGNATGLLRDGMLVTVDGGAGSVAVLETLPR
jgi:rifampicin phosphotransferase